MVSEDVNTAAKEVIDGILAAYEELSRLTGKPIPTDLVKGMLRETLHVAVHELAHAALRASYPELEHLTHSEDRLGECVDEVAARILELVISERLGLATHTIDEHVYELKHYSNLANLPITTEELRKLYQQTTKQAKEGKITELINTVLNTCREWMEEVNEKHT